MTVAIVFTRKPIIGIAGGIGSGKSFIASLLGELGATVISSDEQVHRAYSDPSVKQLLRQWWGGKVFDHAGQVDRAAVAREVFNHPEQLQRLEGLIHPLIARERDRIMQESGSDPAVQAFVWDVPRLFETGLDKQCDAVVFVDAPRDLRVSRVRQDRGWTEQELEKREKLQLPLDKKREMSHYTVVNTADADAARRQVSHVFSRIVTKAASDRLDQPQG